MSSQLQVNQRSFTKMRTRCVTSTCMRDKHEDRPGDPNMRGHSDLDNMEVQHDCVREQQEPRSPGEQAVETSPKIKGGLNLEQGSGDDGPCEDTSISRVLGTVICICCCIFHRIIWLGIRAYDQRQDSVT